MEAPTRITFPGGLGGRMEPTVLRVLQCLKVWAPGGGTDRLQVEVMAVEATVEGLSMTSLQVIMGQSMNGMVPASFPITGMVSNQEFDPMLDEAMCVLVVDSTLPTPESMTAGDSELVLASESAVPGSGVALEVARGISYSSVCAPLSPVVQGDQNQEVDHLCGRDEHTILGSILAPVQSAVLPTPPPPPIKSKRTTTVNMKLSRSSSSARHASKPKTGLTMYEQTIALLIKRSGIQHHFVALPADGTRGGILLAVHSDHFQIVSSVCTANAITAKIQSTHSPCSWWITVVYGPQSESDKLVFLQELRQDYRPLSTAELSLHKHLKARFLGLTAVEKLRARQASRLTYISAAHAKSKLFFLRINGRRRRNFIQHISTPTGTVFSQAEKNNHALHHFKSLLGTPPARSNTLNWDVIGLNTVQGDMLESPFEEEEVLAAITDLHTEKAPGPDGFIGLFFRKSWPIIKGDLMLAVNYFFQLHDQHFKHLNTAHICLLPKNADATSFSDFRPISLSHSIATIISKVLASRLAPSMDHLVSRSQSAFIRKRSIHDNFLYAQNLMKDLKRAKVPSLFLKLDIAKAFDTVRWDYLLEVLQQMGFTQRWWAWVSILLRTANSVVMLNGVRGRFFQHGRGLRQGDPLLPLLFIIAIDPLQKLFNIASEQGLLSPVEHRSAKLRVSLYADDAAIFINPIRDEVVVAQQLLAAFSEASGLSTNINKCAVYPICCDSLDLNYIMEPFSCEIKSFPCKYLGLPLSGRAPRRVDFQPVLDKLDARLSGWKGKLLDKSGRLALVNAVLSSIPVPFLAVFPLKKWAIKKIDKIKRSFLWRGSENANGGHCLVKWAKAARPKLLGGLGILDLERFSRALRLRWLWFQWTDRSWPWIGSSPPCDKTDAALFRASTVVTVGNGLSTSFWHDSWLSGKAPMDIAPNLYSLAWRKNKCVQEELVNLNWTRGLWRMDTAQQLYKFFSLWDLLQEVQLSNQDDCIRWKWTAEGTYSSKSSYLAQFRGSFCSFQGNAIWNAHAEDKHKFFMWLLVQAKVLTADKLALRHSPCNPVCTLCDQQQETAEHHALGALLPFRFGSLPGHGQTI
ncbi:hypothetical protein U9M48_000396 [Paspalum notatum var. saurae]|uniref:Reverse transcriptase domain-containing protein n=1 Tax=Paspalum notatum var. saurae TaxID=547442 RepID=A0AAQ3PI26_PASNO